jgi:hypothetical protein
VSDIAGPWQLHSGGLQLGLTALPGGNLLKPCHDLFADIALGHFNTSNCLAMRFKVAASIASRPPLSGKIRRGGVTRPAGEPA